MKIEIIATTVQEAKVAEANGADRIELITGIAEGGLTPSYGLIKEVVNAVKLPVNVMIRPHSYSFSYSEEDINTMIEDIQIVRELGANGVVLGTLKEDRTIDVNSLEKLLPVAGNLDVTFHRAFDEVDDQEEALEIILRYPQINRILTSGGKANVTEAVDRIKNLVALTVDKPLHILAGSGLTVDNVDDFVSETGVVEIHFGSGVRMEGKSLRPVDPEKVREIVRRFQ
ncbi:copper homeostasis protein CutC [Bacillus sp. FJAT-50079]|uniref:copper homeostasis protein CutC n=1 Tax=Bacillus sp. FJAT-50079 TaxID=2833577 RepID=UPI001BC90701|nr:copper homeostasis protein CutC [Bacillus sp. FJAT-50079]